MMRCILGLLLIVVIAGQTRAGEPAAWMSRIPAEWEKASLTALRGTRDFQFRTLHPSGYLEVVADFDGDGRPDAAGLFVNRRTQRHAVFVTLDGPEGPRCFKVAEGAVDLLARMGIYRIEPGRYDNVCARRAARGKTAEDCAPVTFTVKASGLSYFTFESAARYIYWDGERFTEQWISD